MKMKTKLLAEAHQIISSYKVVFEGYGKLSGKVELEVDYNIKPVNQKPRSIPLALREKLKEELVKLEKEGIIAIQEKHTDWSVI